MAFRNDNVVCPVCKSYIFFNYIIFKFNIFLYTSFTFHNKLNSPHNIYKLYHYLKYSCALLDIILYISFDHLAVDPF